MVLHTLQASPSSAAYADCLRLLRSDDAVLLLGDGVYAAIDNTPAWLELLQTGASVYVLQADAAAAGVTPPSAAQSIAMDGFVTLTERYTRHMAWY